MFAHIKHKFVKFLDMESKSYLTFFKFCNTTLQLKKCFVIPSSFINGELFSWLRI